MTAFEFGLHPFGPLLHRGARIYPASQIHEVWPIVRDFAAAAAGRRRAHHEHRPRRARRGVSRVGRRRADRRRRLQPQRRCRDCRARHRAAPCRTRAGLDRRTAASRTSRSRPRTTSRWAGAIGRTSWAAIADDLRPEALDATRGARRGGAPDGSSFAITVQGGAIGRVPDDAMAFTGRDARFDMSADTAWEDPADDET